MHGRRILVVEDEFLIRMFITEVLSDEGCEVLEAADGQEALAMIASGTDFDLLLTDFQMPGALTGADVAQAARARRPALPVIFVTGRSDSLAVLHPGPHDAFVYKPFGSEEIAETVRRLLIGSDLVRTGLG